MYQDVINQFYLPEWLTVEYIAQNFISFTPLFSYGTTILGIYQKKTSLGFSIDICCTMIISASLRIAYYFIIPYEIALFRQSLIMIVIQIILLKVSLKFRQNYELVSLKPDEINYLREMACIFNDFKDNDLTLGNFLQCLKCFIILNFSKFLRFFNPSFKRYKYFWQWDYEARYWEFTIIFELILIVATFAFKNITQFGELLGTTGLFIESLLPLPQILLLNKLKSVQGFKLLLLVSWFCGDFTKISYLIFGAKDNSQLFLFFAVFQMCLDFYIGYQYLYYKYFYVDIVQTQTFELKDTSNKEVKV